MILLKLLFVLHFIGDFYTHTSKLSRGKELYSWHSLLHVICYTFPFSIVFFLVDNWIFSFALMLIILISHYAIDFFIVNLENKSISLLKSFLVDQCLHLLVLLISWIVLKDYFVGTNGIDVYLQSLELQINSETLISVLLVFIMILKPTSQLIEMLLPNGSDLITNADSIEESQIDFIDSSSKNNINYGAFIGYLERIAIVLLGLLNLWSSIALVITAKSIARFKQLENKQFAQKYLIGTLLSLSITLALLLIFA